MAFISHPGKLIWINEKHETLHCVLPSVLLPDCHVACFFDRLRPLLSNLAVMTWQKTSPHDIYRMCSWGCILGTREPGPTPGLSLADNVYMYSYAILLKMGFCYTERFLPFLPQPCPRTSPHPPRAHHYVHSDFLTHLDNFFLIKCVTVPQTLWL